LFSSYVIDPTREPMTIHDDAHESDQANATLRVAR